MFGFLQGDQKVFYRSYLVYKGYYCSLEAFLRQIKKTKVLSYHLKEVLVPIKCLGFYRVTTKKGLTRHLNAKHVPEIVGGIFRLIIL